MKISASESFSPSTSECTRTSIRSSDEPGFSRRSATSSMVSSQARVITSTTASSVGRRSSSPKPSTMLVSSMWRCVVLLGRADERADHPRDDGPGDLVDELALAARRHPVEHPVDDSADSLLVLGDPLRREAALKQGLDPVVARRVHRDHLLLLALERDAEVVEDHDPADVGGEGLPVEADLAQIGGSGQRPEAGLVGVVVERAPVQRRLAAQAGEQRVGRTLVPELEVAQIDPLQVLFGDHVHPRLSLLARRRFIGHTTDVVEATATDIRDRRELIAEAALEVLEADGGRGLTHRAVDRRAGLPQGSTSNYFPDPRGAADRGAVAPGRARAPLRAGDGGARSRRPATSPIAPPSWSPSRSAAGSRPSGRAGTGALRALPRGTAAAEVPARARRGPPRVPAAGRAAAADRGLQRPPPPRPAAAGAVRRPGPEPAPAAGDRALRRWPRRSARALLRHLLSDRIPCRTGAEVSMWGRSTSGKGRSR